MTWSNRFRLLFGAIAVLVVIAGLTLVFNQRQHSAASETATLTAVDYPVGSTYPGTVTQVDVKEGQQVRMGDPLVSVRSASLLHDLRQGLVTTSPSGTRCPARASSGSSPRSTARCTASRSSPACSCRPAASW